MKIRPRRSRGQLMFIAVMLLLALLVVLLWFNDPAHRPAGESRIGWPEPVPGKP